MQRKPQCFQLITLWWNGLGLWTKPKLCQHQGIQILGQNSMADVNWVERTLKANVGK